MSNEWQTVAALPPLGPGELQLWRIHLGDAVASPVLYRQHLSTPELERADRLRVGQVRMQFVVARACLRVLLGNLLDLQPNLVPITLSAYGKPETPSVAGKSLYFNVAHSRETILIALCRTSIVGVDLEYLDRATDILEVARNAFTPDEFLQIEQISDIKARQRAFFGCWTCKEAVVKADGRGLSLPLNLIAVPVIEPAVSTPVSLPADAAASRSTWFVSEIDLGDEVAGAFAVSLPDLRVRNLNFPLRLRFAARSNP